VHSFRTVSELLSRCACKEPVIALQQIRGNTLKNNTSEPEATKVIQTEVRGIMLRLVGYTRALELCARMNREIEVLDFIDGIKEGETFYDLGACEGRFALYAALRHVQVYAFEPEEMNFRALQQNIELNEERASHRLTPFRYAVGASNHTTTIKIAQPWAGGHQKVLSDVSGRVDLAFNFSAEQEVQVVSLDDFMARNHLPQADHMKIDVDGSELAFIKGATHTLSHPQLRRIIFELHQEDESYGQVKAFLASRGFVVTGSHEVEPHLLNVIFERQAAP
jgi:FkbM family methyltransferase